jgi:hypothetical protein
MSAGKKATIIITIVICVPMIPWALIYLGALFSPNPPLPEIRYGEFPFRLEYEINGERFIMEDTVVCEFDGIGVDGGRGKYLKWKTYLADGTKLSNRITFGQ